jgi:hypothetical protein
LQELASEIHSIIKIIRHGRLQFTIEDFNALEIASRGLAKIAASVSDEVQALGKRRVGAVVAEGQRLLSNAKTVKAEILATHKLKNRVAFVRNMQMLFVPPNESKLDSPAVKTRKRLTRERSERIRDLKPDAIIVWAAAFAPSVWDSNVLPRSTFDYVLEFLESDKPQRWPTVIFDVLNTLGAEEPLQNSEDFRAFLESGLHLAYAETGIDTCIRGES